MTSDLVASRFTRSVSGKTTIVGRRGDTDALIKLRVACDLAIDAAHDLGNPLPPSLEQQMNDLCDAIRRELETRDQRFADRAS
ncbi:MAG TPA: hypothetical protein VNB86_00075 [Gaiellaceae bacterium]|nr:hypothetical protein [Gaiellaceae bacterium]